MSTITVASSRTIRNAPYNLQIAVGSYTGDGTDNRNITSVGFQPNFLLVKGGSNVVVWRSYWMPGDSTYHLISATAPLADAIQSFLTNGFQVGTNTVVNTVGTTYYWIAIRGNTSQNYFRTGFYRGNTTIPMFWSLPIINFIPDVLWSKRDAATSAEWWSSSMPVGYSMGFENRLLATGAFSSFYFSGFQTGGSSRVNANGGYFHYLALKKYSGIINCGTYTGNGQNRSITGVGFTPDLVWVKGNTGLNGKLRMSLFTGSNSIDFGGAGFTTVDITSLDSDGFSVGTGTSVNANTVAYYWVALKAGNYNFPIAARTIASGRTHV